ncbi:PKD domain-containing protein [Hymenobacter busanensis]|uniref:PKD domain-containing protein n=1 Tax=Hymenobacter busanensis TaxID=2607656 RepID=A0AA88JYN7_9BACT|nr:gliding motility-associated C-terminal domain-containing protein [Hymenobacter busanensis]KAA9325553.1 PKD domain-containing protein [Hymenobacter busanensis]
MSSFTFSRFGGVLGSLLLTLLTPAWALASAPTRSLEFIENKGQWDARTRYAALLPAGRLFVEADGLTYSLFDPAAIRQHHEHGTTDSEKSAAPAGKLRAHAYSMRFVGARTGAKLLSTEPTGEVRNYFLGTDSRHWASNVAGYRQVQYDELWNGIDARLYENNQGRLEYDFSLEAGVDAKRIRLRYEHTNGLQLTSEGTLEISTSVGQVTELAPKAWQVAPDGRRQPVSCRYVLRGQGVSFALGDYDRRRPLTIDPTVVFSSFTGSTADNWGFTATYDADGNMYSGGIAFGPGYPATSGAYDASFNDYIDIAIIKYNTATTGPASRVWATYLGGRSTDVPHSMVVNGRGELVILGTTSSNNYPTAGNNGQVFDPTFNGGSGATTPLNGIDYPFGSDLVVTTLSAAGNALVASTFIGGSGNDGIMQTNTTLVHNYGDAFRGDIAVDSDNNVYVVSNTRSSNFPVNNSFDSSFGGGLFDAVVMKLPPNLSTLTWSSFFGGTGDDAAYSIQVSPAREVYIAGGTNVRIPGDVLPYNSAGAYKPDFQGGIADGFVARISASGATLTRMSYLGSGAYDQAYFVQLDEQGGVYVLGQTLGTMPMTPGAAGVANGRLFMQKLTANLDALSISTTFGTTSSLGAGLSPTAFLVDQCERIYVCGWGGGPNTNSPYSNGSITGLFTTANALQRTTDGGDFYLIQFAPYAAAIDYATYFGGNNSGSGEHVDGGTSRFDRRGYVYQAVCGGCGGSSAFPFPPGAGSYSIRNNSTNCNNAAFKFDFGVQIASAGPSQKICANAAPLRLGGSPAGGTWAGTGVTGSVASGFTFTPTPGLVGAHVLTYSAASTGTCVTTSPLTMTVMPVTPIVFAPVTTQCASDGRVTLTATPAGGTFSGPGVLGNTFSPSAAGAGTHTLTYTLAPDLCGVATQQVVVNSLPIVEAGRDTALCALQRSAYQLKGFSPANGLWSGPGCSPTGFFTPPSSDGRVTLFYTYTAPNGCSQRDSMHVVLVPANRTNQPLALAQCMVKPRPAEGLPYYTGLAPFTHKFTHDLLFASRYEWEFGDKTSSTEQFPTHTYERPGTYLVKLTAFYNSTCEANSVFVPVYVGDPFIPNIITPNGDNANDTFEQRLSCLPVELKIFNRWGTQVFEAKDYRNTWGGADLPDGVYYYSLRDTENRKAKGWLEIRH